MWCYIGRIYVLDLGSNYVVIILHIAIFMLSIIVVKYLVLIICVLVAVAFITLLERKVLGYIQIRKGPNKVGYIGLIQPFSDAVKLFTKEQISPSISNFIVYYLSPVFNLIIALVVWACLPYCFTLINFNFRVLYFVCCLRLGVYTTIRAGWSSNSKYSILGRLRAISQTISYEVRLALILLRFLIIIGGFRLSLLDEYQRLLIFVFLFFPLSCVWFVSRLAETNRTPFDFREGESELVSGFNTEYRRGGFALIFIAEYARIIFIRVLFALIFLGGNITRFVFYIKFIFIAFSFIWVRGTLPRFRYDKLMNLSWKCFLPVSLNYLFFFSGMKLYIFCIII